ncbi:MAG: calcium-binding protein [Hyphomicrobiaceae bacterium]
MPGLPINPPAGPFGPDGLALPTGGAGNDVFAIAGFGISHIPSSLPVIDGQGGSDTIDFSAFRPGTAGAGIVVTAGASGLEIRPGTGQDVAALATGIEHVIGSDYADDIAAGAGVSSLLGGGGDDILRGAAGVSLDGGSGNDRYVVGDHLPTLINDTGGGTDTVDLSQLGHGVNVDFITGQITAGLEHASVANVERVITTQFGDFLLGGDGNDAFEDRGGSDQYRGGLGSDVVSYATDSPGGAGHGVIANLATGWAIDRSGVADRLESIESLVLGNGNDFAIGNEASNGMAGGAGNDSLVGGRGSDYIQGGAGNDVIFGSDFAGANNAAVDFDVLFGGDGDDLIMAGFGASANMAGGAGADALWGGDFADTIVMGSGHDIAVGLGGNDRFVVSEAMTAGDWSYIADFNDNAWSNAPDTIVLPTAVQGHVSVTDIAGGAWIGVTLDGGGWYGIMVANMTAAGMADQLMFA